MFTCGYSAMMSCSKTGHLHWRPSRPDMVIGFAPRNETIMPVSITQATSLDNHCLDLCDGGRAFELILMLQALR